jgi:Nuclease-related domain
MSALHAVRLGRPAGALSRGGRTVRRRLLAVALVLAGAAVGASFLPNGGFWAGLLLGAALCLAVSALDAPARFIDANRRTEHELRLLTRTGWHVGRDLRGRLGNAHHVVAGPAGVFLLGSKALQGRVSIEDGVLVCKDEQSPDNEFTLPKLGRQLGGAAYVLQDRLQEQLGWTVEVRPVVVLWADFPECRGRVGGVTVVSGRQLCEWLREQPHRMAEIDRPAVVGALGALPAAA